MDEQVTLTGYADQIRELIRNDRNDEAVAICMHILRYYPKYVDAYRQLGQALLEKGQLDDAKEVFRRVLSADPESVVAYAGLAVILEQEHLVAEAAWHMERAYELAPSNAELHKELHRLYHEVDGRPRARLELTPGALARLYVNEGLFAQAIQELNAIVAENGARFDAQVALAETLWRIGQMRQAAEMAQALLDFLPYCLKANLILGVVWKETGLSESDQYLQRAQALDPTNQIAQRLFGVRSPLPLIQARVPHYVEGTPIASLPVAEATSFTERNGAAPLEAPAGLTFEAARESALFGMPVFKPPVTDTNLPPWLRAAVPEPEIADESIVPAQPAEPVAETPAETMSWLEKTKEPQPEPTAETSGEMPSWLAQLRQSAESSTEPTTAAPSEQADDTSSALPPWMRAEPQAEQAAPTIPSWIEEAKSVEATEAPGAELQAKQAASTILTWIEEAKSAEATETPHAEPQAGQAAPTIPTWIEEAKSVEATEAPRVSEEESQPETTSAVPAWVALLSHAEEPTPAPAEAKPSEQELPPWFSQPTQPVVASVEEPAPVQPETQPRAEELPPWLSQPAQSGVVAPITPPVVSAQPPAAPKRKKVPTRGDSHLILARTYRDANQMNEALAEYDFVVQKAPRLVQQVIADLEVLSKRRDVPIEVHRILGDAYTRADRLAEALEEYRFVLGHVAS